MAKPHQKVLIAAALALLLSACSGAAPDPQELIERAKTAQLQWDTYQEDIKAQMGARPAAEWEGEVVQIKVSGQRLEIVFHVSPPWDTYNAAMPVLVRGPFGKVCGFESFQTEGAKHTLLFAMEELSTSTELPWVEVHYPHVERRFTLLNGQWPTEN